MHSSWSRFGKLSLNKSNTVQAALRVLQNEKQSRPDQEHFIDHATRTPNETATTHQLLHTALTIKSEGDKRLL